MKKIMLFLIFLPFLFLTSCVRSTANYEKVLKTWVGQPVSKLVRSWGSPTKTTQLSKNTRVLKYQKRHRVYYSGYNYSKPTTYYYTYRKQLLS